MTIRQTLTSILVVCAAQGIAACSDNVQVGTAETAQSGPGGAPGNGGGFGMGPAAGGSAETGGNAAANAGAGARGGAGSSAGASAGVGGESGATAGSSAAGMGGNAGAGGAAGTGGESPDPSAGYCPVGTPVAPATWGRVFDAGPYDPAVATDGVSTIFALVDSPSTTDAALTDCQDVTEDATVTHDSLLMRFAPDGACLWRRWLAMSPPIESGQSLGTVDRVATAAGLVLVWMNQSLVAVSDAGALAWTLEDQVVSGVLASDSDFILFTVPQSLGPSYPPPSPILVQHLSTTGAVALPLSFAFATPPDVAQLGLASVPGGSVVIFGNTDVAIPSLSVPAPPPNFDTLFAVEISTSGDVSWTEVFPNQTNLGGTTQEVFVSTSAAEIWAVTPFSPADPLVGSTLWKRSASGDWSSTDYPHVSIYQLSPLPDGTTAFLGYLGLTQQQVVGTISDCGWRDALGPPGSPGNLLAMLPLGNHLLVSGWFETSSETATPPCSPPASADFGGLTFSTPCTGVFLAEVSP